MRTFIAIDLPEEVKAEIFHAFEKLQSSGLVSGNFVQKENLHLTLRFIGEIDEEEIIRIKRALSEIRFENFDVNLGELGFFPNDSFVKVLWVGLESDNLLPLKEKVDEVLEKIGIEKEKNPFSSHITVARVKAVKDRKKFLEKIKTIKLKKMKFSVNEISLIKSELMRGGPSYKTLARYG